jgi:hypothetical protein
MTATVHASHALKSNATLPAPQMPDGCTSRRRPPPETAPLAPDWRPFVEDIVAAVEGNGWGRLARFGPGQADP